MWTKDSIRRLLDRNPRAVRRGIVRLFSFQEIDEQRDTRTRWLNRQGFSVATVKAGTALARKVLLRQTWTREDHWKAHAICRLHAGQLASYANDATERRPARAA